MVTNNQEPLNSLKHLETKLFFFLIATTNGSYASNQVPRNQ